MRAGSTCLFVAFLLLTGCGNDIEDPEELEQRVRAPIFWLGEEFEGLELVHSDGSGRGATFIYGTCDAKGDQGCAPPLQLQNVKCPGEPTAVAIFGGEGGGGIAQLQRAARALRPIGRAPARPPRVAFSRNPWGGCFPP